MMTALEQDYARTGDEALGARVDAAAAAVEARLTAPGALLNSALYYASQGIAVFPCRPGQKRPATLNGFYDATTDPAKIREWWGRMPDANVAYPTGRAFDVLDIDGPTGYESLGQLRADGVLPGIIARATTPRGVHLYLPVTGDGNSTNLLPGIDFRGDGGFVVAPPSRVTADGQHIKVSGVYRWSQPLQPTK